MMFLVSFIFFENDSLAPGNHEYFTAYFRYKQDPENIGPDYHFRYDTTKVGSQGDFFFDKRIRTKSYKDVDSDDLVLMENNIWTYKPLVKFGTVRSPSVIITVSVLTVPPPGHLQLAK